MKLQKIQNRKILLRCQKYLHYRIQRGCLKPQKYYELTGTFHQFQFLILLRVMLDVARGCVAALIGHQSEQDLKKRGLVPG